MKKLFAFIFTLTACLQLEAREYDDVIASGFITIGVYSDFAPYSYRENGIAKGIDVELGKRIAERMGLRPLWFWIVADETLDDDLRNTVWKGHYLGGGVADFMMRVPYDKKYEHKIDGYGQLQNEFVVLTSPYHRESWAIARDLKQIPNLPNLAPLIYAKVGVEIDSAPDYILGGMLRGQLIKSISHFHKIENATKALAEGKLGAVAGMKGQLEWYLKNADKKDSTIDLIISSDGTSQWPNRAWDIGLAIKHTYRQLGYALEAEVDALVKSGELKSIFDKYQMTYQIPKAYQPEN